MNLNKVNKMDKDEYIKQLEKEIEQLKKSLKLRTISLGILLICMLITIVSNILK